MGCGKQEKHHNFRNVNIINQMIMQKKIQPTWYSEAKVICDGKVIFLTGSTKPEIHIDIWSGNHPFYTNSQKFIDSEGRIERFKKKYEIKSN